MEGPAGAKALRGRLVFLGYEVSWEVEHQAATAISLQGERED